MKIKSIFFGLIIATACMFPSWSFAQDYAQVNIFNRFTDWTVTLGKSPDERQRIINERIELRAHDRQTRDHRNDHVQHAPPHQDQVNRNVHDDQQPAMNGHDDQQRHY